MKRKQKRRRYRKIAQAAVTERVSRAIDAYAKEHNVRRSDVIRDALDHYLFVREPVDQEGRNVDT